MMNQPTTQLAASRYRGLVLIWCAQMFALALLFVVAFVVSTTVHASAGETVFVALAAAGMSFVGLSFVVKSVFAARAITQHRPDLVTTAYVLAFMLCEACAILGVVAHFITGARESLYFFAPSALGFLLNFPRRRHVEDATGEQGQTYKTTL